ncbi:hypothetical protein GCWU000342_00111 [Shuttleworthella satelles DSM 14600]|uniref:Uncharacterized protein n=1 Tax=Shuttleworthella satelles DSM 14600 TaxID=626523 RepID=C4G7X4_9FIRM|nr:hypothetical protein GCWU000342_00111 [Shuttleworthia satelles DSM 14600]
MPAGADPVHIPIFCSLASCSSFRHLQGREDQGSQHTDHGNYNERSCGSCHKALLSVTSYVIAGRA